MTNFLLIFALLTPFTVFAQTLSEYGVPQCLEAISRITSKAVSVQKLELNKNSYYIIYLETENGNQQFALISENGSWSRKFVSKMNYQSKGDVKLDTGMAQVELPNGIARKDSPPFIEHPIANNQLKEIIKDKAEDILKRYFLNNNDKIVQEYFNGNKPKYGNNYENLHKGFDLLKKINFSACEKLLGISPQDFLCSIYKIPSLFYSGIAQQHGEVGKQFVDNSKIEDERRCKQAIKFARTSGPAQR